VAVKVIKDCFNTLYERLNALQEADNEPPRKSQKTSLGGSGKAARKVALLGNAGYVGLLELVEPILKSTFNQFSDLLWDHLHTAFLAMLRNFSPNSSGNPSCQLALLFKVIRLVTKEPDVYGTKIGDLVEVLKKTTEKMKELFDSEPDISSLGKAVACDINRVAILEDLYTCCSFVRINGELHTSLVNGIKIDCRYQKPGENPLQLTRDILEDIRRGENIALEELKEVLKSQGLEMVLGVPADGNSFFHAMGYNLWGDTDVSKAHRLRIALCQQILRNYATSERRELFFNENGMTVEQYVRRMCQRDCWADVIAIENFAHLAKRPVFMFQVGKGDPVIFGSVYAGKSPLVVAHVDSLRKGPHFVSVRNQAQMETRLQATLQKTVSHLQTVDNGPDPKFAPPFPPPRAGEVRGGRLIVVLDTSAIHNVSSLTAFEAIYDVILATPSCKPFMIMVPVAVEEELENQRENPDRAISKRARKYFDMKTDNPKYCEIFKRQSEVMDSYVDNSIVGDMSVANLLRHGDRNDGRIQGAVEHLMMMGDHVILFSDDSTIIDGCRMRSSQRGELRIVDIGSNGHFAEVLQGLQRKPATDSASISALSKEQRQVLKELRDGRAQLTIEVLLSLFNP
jgi:hypothetical protein